MLAASTATPDASDVQQLGAAQHPAAPAAASAPNATSSSSNGAHSSTQHAPAPPSGSLPSPKSRRQASNGAPPPPTTASLPSTRDELLAACGGSRAEAQAQLTRLIRDAASVYELQALTRLAGIPPRSAAAAAPLPQPGGGPAPPPLLNAKHVCAVLTRLKQLAGARPHHAASAAAWTGAAAPAAAPAARRALVREVRQCCRDRLRLRLLSRIAFASWTLAASRDDAEAWRTCRSYCAAPRSHLALSSASPDPCVRPAPYAPPPHAQACRWLTTFLPATQHLLPSFSPLEVAGSLHALARLQARPSIEWMDALLEVARPQLPATTPTQLGAILWALAKLGCDPGPAWLDDACRSSLAALQRGPVPPPNLAARGGPGGDAAAAAAAPSWAGLWGGSADAAAARRAPEMDVGQAAAGGVGGGAAASEGGWQLGEEEDGAWGGLERAEEDWSYPTSALVGLTWGLAKLQHDVPAAWAEVVCAEVRCDVPPPTARCALCPPSHPS